MNAPTNRQLVVSPDVHAATKAAAASLGIPVKVLVERALVRELRRCKRALSTASAKRARAISGDDALSAILSGKD